jgi:phosphate starvation-inducible PhoH-like protein
MSISERTIEVTVEEQKAVFGQLDSFVKIIERALNVTLIARNGEIKLIGEATALEKAQNVFDQLLKKARAGEEINEQSVNYALALSLTEKTELAAELDKEIICHTIQGKPVKPKTVGQKNYTDLIAKNMITFGVGPAGTGKTYLAMAMAVRAFKNDEISRIILTRPAIEAGEKLGFLPGDLQSKVDPYLRPLYDALFQLMGAENFHKNMEKGLIEVAPLAYMRGRTLDNAFIILDEAQNTTPAQMKMFLTRIGFGSKAVITGDITQKDLAPGQVSGLDIALEVLKKTEGIGVARLSAIDVVRHPLVQAIVEAYERYEKKQGEKREKAKTDRKTKRGKA